MSSVTSLKYPKKSHRKYVTIPEKSAALAEFFGLMLGDGGIGNPWQLTITMNSEKDKQYSEYISNACESLFGIRPAVRKRKNQNALVIVLSSTTVVDFLVGEGIPRGNKLAGSLMIPKWIMENAVYRRLCVRGLMDTDGGLYIHRHTTLGRKYQNIGLCFTSLSGALIRQVADIFRENGIMPHITRRGTNVNLYSAKAIEQYLQIFGTSNERISNLYKFWREHKAPDSRFTVVV